MTDEPTARDLYEARVRHRIGRLPRFGYGDRDGTARAIIEQGYIYAADRVREVARADDAHLEVRTAALARERDDYATRLKAADASWAALAAERDQARAECEELNRQVAERTAERDEALKQAEHWRSWAHHGDEERDRLRELLNEAAIADPMPAEPPSGLVTIGTAPAIHVPPLPDPPSHVPPAAPDPALSRPRDSHLTVSAVPAPESGAGPAAPAAVRPRASRAKAAVGDRKAEAPAPVTDSPGLGSEEAGFRD